MTLDEARPEPSGLLTTYTLRPLPHPHRGDSRMTEHDSTTYRSVGVDYDLLDAGKRQAILAALGTSALAAARGGEALDSSRGEPAFVMSLGGQRLALVIECLGTKSILAREYEAATGVNRFDWIGYDTVAAIVNDLCAVGALPLMMSAYFATGSPDWYAAPGRFDALVSGWRRGCEDSGAVWGGGESPMLNGVVEPDEIELGGCAVGIIPLDGRRCSEMVCNRATTSFWWQAPACTPTELRWHARRRGGPRAWSTSCRAGRR